MILLKLLGAILLLIGLAALFIAPVEVYTLYQFIPGGQFAYEGFNFGTFMFAYILIQIAGYYGIAATGIALGISHLKLARWARPLMLTGLWLWLVVGLPLTITAYLMLFTSKALELPAIIISLVFGPLIYPVAPLLLFRFYRSEAVRAAFERDDIRPSWPEAIPLSVRGLCALIAFTIALLHLPMLLRGVFPFWGVLLSGMEGFLALDALVIVLGLLLWGLARLKPWAWWGMLATALALAASSGLTAAQVTLRDILLAMQLPPYEMQIFSGVPFLDSHLAIPALIPWLVLIAALLGARRHFARTAYPRQTDR
jgi:hypothetical protein